MNPVHVVILGCGRSGTSIFGELFEDLTPYQYYSEPLYEQLKIFDYRTPIAIKVPKEHEVYPPDSGLSFPLDDLLKTIPTPVQFYWQVRHPLDTICSLKVGISKNWGHHPRPENWQTWQTRPLLEQCAYHWVYLNSVGYAQVAHLVNICRFEEMLTEPLLFAKSIATEVGLAVEKYQEDIQNWAKRVQNENNAQFVEAQTSRPYSTQDHRVKIGRWQENLNQREVRQLIPMIEETAAKFGYFF